MKVLMINGSPKHGGNTATALKTVSEALRKAGIETERIEIGNDAIHGCSSCGRCFREKDRRCVFNDDLVNKRIDDMIAADGFVIGSPVYYAGINGALKCFLDRTFFVAAANGSLFRHKVGAGVVAVRRGGEVTAWDQLNKYFTISEMFVPSGNYWNMLFGMSPGDGERDVEGMQNMRVLGENMAWLLKIMADGRARTPPPPAQEKAQMNFIR